MKQVFLINQITQIIHNHKNKKVSHETLQEKRIQKNKVHNERIMKNMFHMKQRKRSWRYVRQG